MNSRDRRESFDPLEIILRESLMARAAHKTPSPDVRRRLLQRAARQQRRWAWRLPISIPGLFADSNRRLESQPATHHHLQYVEALFGPRLSWFPLNQVLR
jgi:hypothetical protein